MRLEVRFRSVRVSPARGVQCGWKYVSAVCVLALREACSALRSLLPSLEPWSAPPPGWGSRLPPTFLNLLIPILFTKGKVIEV